MSYWRAIAATAVASTRLLPRSCTKATTFRFGRAHSDGSLIVASAVDDELHPLGDGAKVAHDRRVRQRASLVLAALDLRPQAILGDADQQVGAIAGGSRWQAGDRHCHVRDVGSCLVDGDANAAVRPGDRALDRAPRRGEVAADERVLSVDDHLRRVDVGAFQAVRVLLLPRGQGGRREPILPAEPVPVVDVLAEAHDLDTRGGLRFDQLLEQRVGRGTARTALRREEFHEDGDRRPGCALGSEWGRKRLRPHSVPNRPQTGDDQQRK